MSDGSSGTDDTHLLLNHLKQDYINNVNIKSVNINNSSTENDSNNRGVMFHFHPFRMTSTLFFTSIMLQTVTKLAFSSEQS